MDEFVFPLDAGQVSWSTKKKQAWKVTEFVSASGERKSLVQQEYPKITFEINFPALTKHDVDVLMAFYAKCKGSWHPFFYKDCEEYRAIEMSLENVSGNTYQAVIPCSSYAEPATLVDQVMVWSDNERIADFSVDGGLITVPSAMGPLRFDYEYYYRVVFGGDLTVTQKFRDIYSVSLSLVTAR